MDRDIINSLTESFKIIYGHDCENVFFAPGRVNLIGEHTDYNGGHVFPCALTLGTYGAVCRRSDKNIKLSSLNVEKGRVSSFGIGDFSKSKMLHWTDYPRGVFWVFDGESYSIDSGVEILFYGDIPAGSGLSSSASLEVLTGIILKEVYNLDSVSTVDIAKYGQRAENEFVGVNCGIMDQFASAMGRENHAIFLNTGSLQYSYPPLDLKEHSIVITNSMVKHELSSSGYNERRSQCNRALELVRDRAGIVSLCELDKFGFEEYGPLIHDSILYKRARHAVFENLRTIEAKRTLEKGDLEAFGELMNESHKSLRDDYEVSCRECDFLVERSWEIPGVLGSRITGGGFGGCTVSIVENDKIEYFCNEIRSRYKAEFHIDAEFYTVCPGEGARHIRI